MMHSTGRLAAVAVALFWFTTGNAQADPSWSYSWERGPATIDSDSPGTGGVSLAPFAVGSKTGSQFINGLTFTTFSSATTTPDHFTNAIYFLTLHLTDLGSGATGSVTFDGKFNGDLTATAASLTQTYTSPLSETITLGANDYKVTVGPSPVLSAPNSTVVTTLGAQVDVSAHTSAGGSGDGSGGAGGSGGVAATPEPASLVLAGLAAPLLGWSWKRRRPHAA
jgi:hypothetical protein